MNNINNNIDNIQLLTEEQINFVQQMVNEGVPAEIINFMMSAPIVEVVE